jgi:hypothetical protein
MKPNTVARCLAAALVAAVVAPQALAQGSDELWEVKSQMNMAGMPPGMGSSTQQVCRDKDPKKEIERRRDMQGCKVTDYKESGNKLTVSMTCPQGTGVMEYTYNAARTEYTASLRMKTKDGEMAMTMQGRKLGACDAKQARAERDAKGDKMRAEVAKAQAGAMASMKQSQDQEIQNCAAAVKTMDMGKLGMYARCKQSPDFCKAMQSSDTTKHVATACTASRGEFCKRYQTVDGFALAEGNKAAGEMCDVNPETVKTSLCPQAAKAEHLGFLGRFCPAEAKPIAQKNCVGRDFTSAPRDKYTDFCRRYMARGDLESPKPAEKKSGVSDTMQGVSKGIDKIRGLFGR